MGWPTQEEMQEMGSVRGVGGRGKEDTHEMRDAGAGQYIGFSESRIQAVKSL